MISRVREQYRDEFGWLYDGAIIKNFMVNDVQSHAV